MYTRLEQVCANVNFPSIATLKDKVLPKRQDGSKCSAFKYPMVRVAVGTIRGIVSILLLFLDTIVQNMFFRIRLRIFKWTVIVNFTVALIHLQPIKLPTDSLLFNFRGHSFRFLLDWYWNFCPNHHTSSLSLYGCTIDLPFICMNLNVMILFT